MQIPATACVVINTVALPSEGETNASVAISGTSAGPVAEGDSLKRDGLVGAESAGTESVGTESVGAESVGASTSLSLSPYRLTKPPTRKIATRQPRTAQSRQAPSCIRRNSTPSIRNVNCAIIVTVRASPSSRSSARSTTTQLCAIGLSCAAFGYIHPATLTSAKGPKSAQIACMAMPEVMFPHRYATRLRGRRTWAGRSGYVVKTPLNPSPETSTTRALSRMTADSVPLTPWVRSTNGSGARSSSAMKEDCPTSRMAEYVVRRTRTSACIIPEVSSATGPFLSWTAAAVSSPGGVVRSVEPRHRTRWRPSWGADCAGLIVDHRR
ncbi:Uncharacterised protein [Mycobacteroides abscessus subsp. abscessus]|nr:Uncharacterised protein [Mycobacteroides abscessus subsp. abscessus]